MGYRTKKRAADLASRGPCRFSGNPHHLQHGGLPIPAGAGGIDNNCHQVAASDFSIRHLAAVFQKSRGFLPSRKCADAPYG
jgi:hypothetical protein